MQVTLTKTIIDTDNATQQNAVLSELCDSSGGLTVTVVLSGNPAKDNYGVPNTPEWWFIDNIEIEEFDVNGVSYDYDTMSATFSTEVLHYLDELVENIEHDLTDWEE